MDEHCRIIGVQTCVNNGKLTGLRLGIVDGIELPDITSFAYATEPVCESYDLRKGDYIK